MTIATYYNVKVANAVASPATGIAPEYMEGEYHLVSTMRTTPDQNTDVNYVGDTMVGYALFAANRCPCFACKTVSTRR